MKNNGRRGSGVKTTSARAVGLSDGGRNNNACPRAPEAGIARGQLSAASIVKIRFRNKCGQAIYSSCPRAREIYEIQSKVVPRPFWPRANSVCTGACVCVCVDGRE